MKTKITDTSNAINAGGRAEKWWKGKPVKSRSSSWAFYTKSNAALFYWPEAEFKKLLPKMDKLIREVKKTLNSK